MQWTDAFCYAVFTITVTASIARAENDVTNQTETEKTNRIAKRETAVLIEDFPVQTYREPKAVYRKVTRYTYKPKPKYRPTRSKYAPRPKYPKRTKSKRANYKYGQPSYKKRPSKYRYPSKGKKPYSTIKARRPKPYHTIQNPPEPTGFGEPPMDFGRMPYEQPVDSYGAPLTPTGEDFRGPAEFQYEPEPNFGLEDQRYQWDDNREDNANAYSKRHPTYSTLSKPIEHSFYETSPQEYDEGFDLNSYADVYNFGKKVKDNQFLDSRRRPEYPKPKAPWKSKKKVEGFKEVVGGQYAEPPARYVPKFQPSAPMFEDDEEFGPARSFDEDMAASASVSKYVNYKNSNMAFSPQNLNDAFSIVDK